MFHGERLLFSLAIPKGKVQSLVVKPSLVSLNWSVRNNKRPLMLKWLVLWPKQRGYLENLLFKLCMD